MSAPLHEPEPGSIRERLSQPTGDVTADAMAAELVQVLDQYMADLKAGRASSRAELVARHPALATQLEACLAGLEFIHAAAAAPHGRAQRLGDFRIIREVGRGGMGAVFEAEQISLGRSVALKILRFGGVSDADAIERFKREAETVAKLHHTNIVPIYNVGSEHGVNYYAMQFIDGRSLAEVLAEAKRPLGSQQVAEWGLQAAEALAHAHHRGVIHRDVKPSNLLLDRENRLWLTDFGRARRLDDVTLSITGALLGTPRYMSPEQAIAAHKQVDHRSDLFSLGSTLYELLTYKPAFPGDSPHAVIQNILTCEPTPIRQLVTAVPRDLETIVLKCMAKEPRERYSAASELAADLRDFLDGRPIQARRASFIERTTRWYKHQQQSVRLAATAAVITLCMTAGVASSWYGYDSWRQATLKLNTVIPPLVVEVLDKHDHVVRVETAPMQNAVSFPQGDYQVRILKEGELSQTLDVALSRNTDSSFSLDLHDQLLWTPRNLEQSFDVVDLSEGHGLVLWNEKGIGLRRNLELLSWSRELGAAQLPEPDKAAGFRWPWNQEVTQYSGYGHFDLRPWVAPQALDVAGDGKGYLIVGARHQAWLMAVSSDDGAILWFAGRGHDVSLPASQPARYFDNCVKSAILSEPILTRDCNGDGVRDIIVTFVDVGPQPVLVRNRYTAKCWIEAVSGKTGEMIWSYDLPAEWFELPAGEEVPYDLRWFAGPGGGISHSGGGISHVTRHLTREGGRLERTGPHGYRPAMVSLMTVARQSVLGIVAGTHYVALDPTNGTVASGPVSTGVRPNRRCQAGDVDGDGATDLIALEQVATTIGTQVANQVKLIVWSPTQQRQLWSKTLEADWPRQQLGTVEPAAWPLLVDLNGDLKCEVIVPNGQSGGSGLFSRGSSTPEIPWGIVSVLNGDSGEPLWTRRLVSMDRRVDHFVGGPDLDQDGYREVFAVTMEGDDFRIHVDAFSGQTGDTLWTNSLRPVQDNNSSISFHLIAPQWFTGADGWPQLIVEAVANEGGQNRSIVGLFSAGTGHLTKLGHNITALRPADMDGDQVDDLLVYNAKSPNALDRGGTLHCLRGVANEKWGRLGNAGQPSADLDGDGVRDLLAGWPSSILTAVSSRTGESLWHTQVEELGREFQVRAADAPSGHSGDLDGDGIVDLLGWIHPSYYNQTGTLFFALSGKTGRKLWTAPDITVQRLNSVIAAEAHDLDGDQKPEVIWLAVLDYGYPVRNSLSSNDCQLWVFVTSGQTGQLRWARPLSVAFGQTTGTMQVIATGAMIKPSIGDINGDGTSDLLVPRLTADGRSFETQALSGKDGAPLWTRPFPVNLSQQPSFDQWIPPAICDLDSDGLQEVVLVELVKVDAAGNPIQPRYQVVAAQGRDGSEVWNWISQRTAEYWISASGKSRGEWMRPQVLRVADEQPRVAVLLPGNEGTVVVFEADGKSHERLANYATSQAGIWPCDSDGDAIDEIAYLDGARLCIVAGNKLDTPIWQRTLGYNGPHQIIGVLPGNSEKPPVIAVALDASDNSVLGFDAATGQRVWTCPGVISRDAGTYSVPSHVTLLDESRSPNVYYNYNAVSRCRRAVPTAQSQSEPSAFDAMDAKSWLTLRGGVPATIQRAKQIEDPRWERSLPWVSAQRSRTPKSETAITILWAIGFAGLLVVAPGAFLARLAIARRFGLRMLMILPVVAGLFLMACLVNVSHREFAGLWNRFSLGFGFSSVVIAIGMCVRWLIQGQWNRLGFWLGMTVIVSSILAAFALWNQAPMLPEEHYSLTDGYMIWFFGAFVTTWMLVIMLPIAYVLRWFWRGRRLKSVPLELRNSDSTIAANSPVKS